VGVIVAAYSMTNLVGNVVAGRALDRFGRVPLLLFGAFGTAAVVATYALVRAPEQLLALRLLHGAAVAALAPGAFALAGDLAPAERRARVMGINGAVIALAAIVAPAFAGVLEKRSGFALVFLVDAGLLATAGVLVALLAWAGRTVRGDFGAVPRQGEQAPYHRQGLLGPYVAVLFFTLALGTFVTGLPERLHALGIAPSLRGAAFSTYGLLAALVMVSPLASRLVRRDWRAGAAIGLLAIAVGLAVASAPAVSSLTAIERAVLGGAALFGLGFGLLFPALTTEVAQRAAFGHRGRAFGIFYALYSLGVIGGSLLAGWVSEWRGPESGWPLLAGAALAALGVLFPLLDRRWRRVSAA
jgi:MFS family permease